MGMWDEDGYEKPSKRELREDRAREFNEKQRSVIRSVGENMATVGAILIVLLFVGYIWTDFSLQLSLETILLDGAVTVVCLILMESLWTQNGIKGGKLDEEYIAAHKSYLDLREKVTKLGLNMMNAFCDWQIDIEYEYYLRKRCKEFKIDYKNYAEELSKMPLAELKKIYPADIAAKVFALRSIKPIELTSEMLMTDGASTNERGGVSISAQEYVRRETVGWVNILATIVAGFCSAGIAFSLNEGASWGLVMYTLMKLILLARRIFKGYSKGSRAYSVIEVKHISDKTRYLNLYVEFVEKKIYLSLGDKYDLPGESDAAIKENKPSL